MYKAIDTADIRALREICGEDRVIPREQINEDYAHDEMPVYGKYLPEVLVEACSTDEVSRVMRYCFENNIPVTPRGAGTGLCGGAVAVYGGVLLSTVRMNKIIEVDEENLTATAECGVLLMELAEHVQKLGLFYPPEPGEKSATLGGNVMTNAGGMKAIKYGVTRDYVMGMEVVLPSGEVMNLGGKLAKSSSGYSLMHLLVGSEGTLGIVTKLILKLIPKPNKTISLLVPFETLTKCIEAVPVIIKACLAPTAVEFMQREVIEAAEEYLGKRFPDKSSDAYLLLSFDGADRAEVEKKCDTAAELCLSAGAKDALFADTEERFTEVWSARSAFLEAIKCSTPDMDECDVVVPRSKIDAFVSEMRVMEKKHDIRIRYFGHAGDGNIHVYVCKDALSDAEWEKRVRCVMDELYAAAARLSGKVSGEHGIGHAKIDYLRESEGELYMKLSADIKRAFDPNGLLNPGKVVGRI